MHSKRAPLIIAFLITLPSLIIIAIVSLLSYLKPFLPFKNYLLGIDQPTSYLILLQNDTELRANGGFAGSYAKLNISTSKIVPKIDLSFQDIYVPNGQLSGHVTPPPPIQEAFHHGTWELANADYDPDFPTAAQSIRWFFEKGGEKNPDILATLSLTTIKNILRVTGPINISDYSATITSDNVYSFLQSQSETNFFPGSTQKKDALTAVGKSIKNKLFHLSPIQYLRVARILITDLDHGNLLLNSQNLSFQKLLLDHHWAGEIKTGKIDTYLLVETNLGANKANCCIERETKHVIFSEDGTYRHRVQLTLTNTSSGHNPTPPFDFSGHYLSYLRFYIPSNAWGVEIAQNESTPSGVTLPYLPIVHAKNHGLTEIGFFHTTASGTTSTIDLSYRLATGSASRRYELTLLKQNGLRNSPQTIQHQGQTTRLDLTQQSIFIP